MFNRNRSLIHCMMNLHNTFWAEGTVNFTSLSQLPAFPSKPLLKGDRFSLTNNSTLFWKHNFALSIFVHAFLSRIRLQNFLLANLTIVVFGLPLPILWDPSISLFSTVRLIDLHILSTLCSRWLSDTVAGIPWISMLFLLVYWSSLFLEISSSVIFYLRESTLDFNFKFSAFKASIIKSFTLIKLSLWQCH